MIILFNIVLSVLFFFKGFFLKNEFSLIRTTTKHFYSNLKVFLNFKDQTDLFSFKKFIRIYLLFKLKLNSSSSAGLKKVCFIYYTVINAKTKWTILNSFLLQRRFIKIKPTINFTKVKLNIFLANNSNENLKHFTKNFQSNYFINYKASSLTKYINDNHINTLFLRKNKIFNKGRYSRNRQLYRTGVYWCIWLSVFLGYCLYFSFYRLTFNFGYQWWLVFSFLFLFINQKMFKYNFYNSNILILELKKNFNWVSLIMYNFWKKLN